MAGEVGGLGAAGLESAVERLWRPWAPASLGPESQAVKGGTSQRPCPLWPARIPWRVGMGGPGAWALSPLSWTGGRSLSPEGVVGTESAGW